MLNNNHFPIFLKNGHTSSPLLSLASSSQEKSRHPSYPRYPLAIRGGNGSEASGFATVDVTGWYSKFHHYHYEQYQPSIIIPKFQVIQVIPSYQPGKEAEGQKEGAWAEETRRSSQKHICGCACLRTHRNETQTTRLRRWLD